MSDNIKVVVRLRPLIEREQQANSSHQWTSRNDNEIHSIGKSNATVFTYDRVFDIYSNNVEVFNQSVKHIVSSAMQGFNGTIFAYGQTSSGKTHTIMGNDGDWGVVPLTVSEIFEAIENTTDRLFLLRVSYMEIYNEVVMDLLSGESKLKIHENSAGDIFVSDLTEEFVRDDVAIFNLLQKGEARRHFGETNMNDRSSRSHTIFRIIIESREISNDDVQSNERNDHSLPSSGEAVVQVSQLNIVDLAGSERASQTGATGDRLKEGCAINKSLFTLAQVISKLSEQSAPLLQVSGPTSSAVTSDSQFVNFRDSKLTRILQNSLGGNSKTAIICTVTPASYEETLSTLKFANRAKFIKNKPVKNEVGSDEAMLRRYQKQINELKTQIHQLSERSNVQALELEKDILTKQLSEKEEKIEQLMHLICISSKLGSSPRCEKSKASLKNRRLTWCPGLRNNFAPTPFSPFVNRFKNAFDRQTSQRCPLVPVIMEKTEESSFIALDKESLNRELIESMRNKSFEFDQYMDTPKTVQTCLDSMTPLEDRLIIITYDSSTQTDEIESLAPSEPYEHQILNHAFTQTEADHQPSSSTSLETNASRLIELETPDDQIHSTVITVESPNVESTNENILLLEENDSLKRQTEDLTLKIVELNAHIEAEKKHAIEMQHEIDELKKLSNFNAGEAKRHKEDVHLLADELERLQSDVAVLKFGKRNETLEFVNLEETESLRQQLAECQNDKQELHTLNERIVRLQTDLADANLQCETLFMEKWELNKVSDKKQKELEQMKIVNENQDKENAELRNQLSKLVNENQEKENVELVDQINKLTEMQALIENREEEIVRLKSLVAEFREAKVSSEHFEMENLKLQSKVNEFERVQILMENLENEIVELRNKVNESEQVQALAEKYEKEAIALRNEVAELKNIEALAENREKHVIELQSQLEKLQLSLETVERDELKRLRTELERSKNEHEKLIKSYNALQQRFEETCEQFDADDLQYSTKINELEKSLTELEIIKQEKIKENEMFMKQISRLKQQLQMISIQNDGSRSMNSKQRQEISDLNDRLKENHAEMAILAQRLKDLERKNIYSLTTGQHGDQMPLAGMSCRSSAVVEDHNLFILQRQNKDLVKKLSSLEKNVALLIAERDEAKQRLMDLENQCVENQVKEPSDTDEQTGINGSIMSMAGESNVTMCGHHDVSKLSNRSKTHGDSNLLNDYVKEEVGYKPNSAITLLREMPSFLNTPERQRRDRCKQQ